MNDKLISRLAAALLLAALVKVPVQAQAAGTPPNIVMIMADDVAPFDISAIHRGLGAVNTPNIDRLAREGMIVSDYYAQPSCTAGRAAFLTGQYPIRTGLTSVGTPGAKIGLKPEDPTLAQMLNARGYNTALFGKSHVGDRNEYLPTMHGFGEFFGILYHLNMMNMVEQPEFPKEPGFAGRPRNVLYTKVTDQDDATEDPRFGRIGKQSIEDRGMLGAKRQETFDDEVLAAASDWLNRSRRSGKPFFLWFAPTRMHQPTNVSPEWEGRSGHSRYADGLLHLDSIVGKLLKQLDDMGAAKNTIVMFTADNGVNLAHWPDSGTPAFRGEKGTTWDGGFRVPMLVRWPGHVQANSWTGEFMTSEDWLPTLMAVAGDTDIKERLLKGAKIGEKEYKVHLDGYNQVDMLTGKGKSKRHEFFFYAETSLNAVRVDQWKAHLAVKNSWLGGTEKLDGGMLINIKLDPFELTPQTGGHLQWEKEKQYIVPMVLPHVEAYFKSLRDFRPRQRGTGIGAALMFNN
ncbi:arylsulfatase [Sulfuritalea hydrogenivorans]|uniref:Sulfatase family protein n=1 Tax=Sulfuritalea hydrogenivorans sk43H TaxID=1223802 RepID=W0SC61_9PROT|nr:arylsulfatase [Sulfuritalea hydrogenivorans]BAO28320.1 sulfatase family protein [Sulfuritalea hydrogenivorans sk43H]